MIRTSRREVLLGGLAVSTLAGVPQMALARGQSAVLVHDPSLAAGRRLAAAHGGEALAIEGDRIRFARAVFARQPSLVVGVSRHADALLIEEVGREAGYVPVDSGAEALQGMLAEAQRLDRGRVLGWALAPR